MILNNINPLGMVMDLIRSGYIVPMVLSLDAPPVMVQWMRADPNAVVFPGSHCFGSMDWADDFNVDFGEQRPPRGKWVNLMRPAKLNGDGRMLGTLDEFNGPLSTQFRDRVITFENEPLTIAYHETGIPDPDNVTAGVAPSAGAGGLRWVSGTTAPPPGEVCADCATFPLDPLCDVEIPDTLYCHFHQVGGTTCCLDGITVKVKRDPSLTCVWTGTLAVTCSSASRIFVTLFNALDGTATPWDFIWGADNITQDNGQSGQDSASASPFSLQWLSAEDNQLCDSPAFFEVTANVNP